MFSQNVRLLHGNPPDVRAILYYGPPADIEAYTQEVGLEGETGKSPCQFIVQSQVNEIHYYNMT